MIIMILQKGMDSDIMIKLNRSPYWGLECIECFNDKTNERIDNLYESRESFGMSRTEIKEYLRNIFYLKRTLEEEMSRILTKYPYINKYIRPKYSEKKRKIYLLYNLVNGFYEEQNTIENILKKYVLSGFDFFIDKDKFNELDMEDSKKVMELLNESCIESEIKEKFMSMYLDRESLYIETKLFIMECEIIGRRHFGIIKNEFNEVYDRLNNMEPEELKKYIMVCNEDTKIYENIEYVIQIMPFNSISYYTDKHKKIVFEIGFLFFELVKREKKHSENYTRLSGNLSVLSDEKRLEILKMIKEKKNTINAISEALQMSKNEVIVHIDNLVHNEIIRIKSDVEGNETFSINNETLKVLGAEIIAMCE